MNTASEPSPYVQVSDPAEFGKVAVLMGGCSAERDISLQSGKAVLAALQQRGVDAQAVDAEDTDVLGHMKRQGYTRAFIALHGRGGEDGVIQGALETMRLPYTGSGVLGSALSMDKIRTKQIWQAAGLPTPEFALLKTNADLDRVAVEIGFPLMMKPVREGSSIGMSKVDSVDQLNAAWHMASQYDDWVMAERWVVGTEYTAAILNHAALPLIRLQTPHTFYDYEAKYQADSTEYICPCGLDSEHEEAWQQLAMQAFKVVGAEGWGRVDFMVDETGQAQLIEVNTVPGMTDHSLVPMAARVAGLDFNELVWRILCTSMEIRRGY